MTEKIIATLKTLGFTEYEAKAYISLVGFGMATAREIHEHSQVPQGRIYSVLKSLLDKNYIEMQEGNPSYYYAENPTEILNKLKSEINDSIDETMEYLSNLHLESKPPAMIWVIHSEWGIKNRLKTLIQSAEKSIFIWINDPAIFNWIKPELLKLKRKVNVEIYAEKKSDFVGSKLRINEFNQNHIKLIEEAESIIDFNDSERNKMILIFDDKAGFSVGKHNGQIMGVSIHIPHIAYMIKSVIKLIGDQ